MITSKIICVTNRTLCREDVFLPRIRILAKQGIPVILREKDLPESEYHRLAGLACREHPGLILHSFPETARKLQVRNLHLPMHQFRELSARHLLGDFRQIGVSVHSVQEAQEAQTLHADYLIAGHIFRTDCKKDLPPRGLEFLEEICRNVRIPVYAIGGISAGNVRSVLDAGATGVCIMSGFMQCTDITQFLEEFLCGSDPKN